MTSEQVVFFPLVFWHLQFLRDIIFISAQAPLWAPTLHFPPLCKEKKKRELLHVLAVNIGAERKSLSVKSSSVNVIPGDTEVNHYHFPNSNGRLDAYKKSVLLKACPLLTGLTSTGLLRLFRVRLHHTVLFSSRKRMTVPQKEGYGDGDKSGVALIPLLSHPARMRITQCIILRKKLHSPHLWIWSLVLIC